MGLHKGLFITFEGGEGAGKTTLIEKVVHYLTEKGLPFLKTREPGGTQLGEEIRSSLLKLREGQVSPYAELCLFLASRAQHVFELIEPALQHKKIVLCDRFNDSSIAYQGAARGLGEERVAQLCKLAVGLEPDLTFYLDIEPQIGLARAKRTRIQDRIEAEDIAFHQKIRESYLSLCHQHKGRFYLIDATLPPDVVYEKTIRRLDLLL